MGRDRLAELREEWYSQPERQPETVEEEIDDELLALEVLFRSRGVVVAGPESVVTDSDTDKTEAEQPDPQKPNG